jgi:hypothetical protein
MPLYMRALAAERRRACTVCSCRGNRRERSVCQRSKPCWSCCRAVCSAQHTDIITSMQKHWLIAVYALFFVIGVKALPSVSASSQEAFLASIQFPGHNAHRAQASSLPKLTRRSKTLNKGPLPKKIRAASQFEESVLWAKAVAEPPIRTLRSWWLRSFDLNNDHSVQPHELVSSPLVPLQLSYVDLDAVRQSSFILHIDLMQLTCANIADDITVCLMYRLILATATSPCITIYLSF